MWWGGGGGGAGANPITSGASESTPIPIRGRRSESRGDMEDEEEASPNTSMASSVSSSYGSPSSDLHQLRDLRHQFDDQEQLLGQIREALQSSQRKTTPNQDFASRLAQMRQARRGGGGGGPTVKTESTPVLPERAASPLQPGGKKSRGAKMQILRKQLEETKARQMAEASSRKELEDIVMSLQQEISKRDNMIASLQLSSVNSSVISSPFVMSPEAVSPSDSPGTTTPPAYGYQQSDLREQLSAKDNRILELSEQVAELGRKVFDLEENLREKDEVIAARTQAVGLTAASLSAKGKNTLEQLEDTQEQLREVQARWAAREAEWRRDSEEARAATDSLRNQVNRLTEERTLLEQGRSELEGKGRELRQQIGELEAEVAEVRSRGREEKILLEARLEELEEGRQRLEAEKEAKEKLHYERVLDLEKRLREERGGSEDQDKLVDLEIALAESEEEKGNLQLRILELEEVAANEGKLRTQLAEADEEMRRCQDDVESHARSLAMLESEKLDLMEALATRDDLLTQRAEEVARLAAQLEEAARTRVGLEMRCLELEELRDRWEGERLELVQALEAEKLASRDALKPFEHLQLEHNNLVEEHSRFKQEHATALERSRLYDKDLMEKYAKIKELTIETTTLEAMLAAKNIELTENFGQLADKEKEIAELRDQLSTLSVTVAERGSEISRLTAVMSESEDHQRAVDMRAHLDKQAARITELEAAACGAESEKEALSSRLEAAEKKFQEAAERTASLLVQIQAVETVAAGREQELTGLLVDEKAESARLMAQLESILTEQAEKMADIQNRLADRDMETTELLARIEFLTSEFDKKAATAAEEKERLEKLNEELVDKVEQMTYEISRSKEELAGLQAEMALKVEDLAALNEDILGKYRIIEDLQQERDREEELVLGLREELEAVSYRAEQLRQQLADKDAELEQQRLQLVNGEEKAAAKVEALDRQAETARKLEQQLQQQTEASKEVEQQIQQLQEEVLLGEEELTKLKKTLEHTQAELEQEKGTVIILKTDLAGKDAAMETLQTVVDVLRRDSESASELAGLEQRLNSLQADADSQALELAEARIKLASEAARNEELRQQIGCLETEVERYASRHQIEEAARQVETGIAQSASEVSTAHRLYEEELAHLRSELAEKIHLLEASTSDSELRGNLEELRDRLELKEQELEDCRTLMRRTEAEKTILQDKLTEVEEYRLELVKESNQHAVETGEKMADLRAQLTAATTEKAKFAADNARLQQELSSVIQTKGSHARDEGARGGSMDELVAERDSLREKNEKLKVMCKKYVAKLKQFESGSVQSPLQQSRTSSEEEEHQRRKLIEQQHGEIEQLRAESVALNEVVAANNAALAALEANFADSLGQLDKAMAEVGRLKAEAAEREMALTAKDDLVRELKTKLEAAPEDITVPVAAVMAEEAEAAAKAKSELTVLKEKYKRLIIKVKQQDELLKKERLKSSASNSSVIEDTGAEASSGSNNNLAAERSALAAEIEKLMTDKSALIARLDEAKAGLAEAKEENGSLQERVAELEAIGKNLVGLEAKVERLVAERTAAYEAQTELKAELQSLRQEKQSAVAAREAADSELRKLREANLVSQMQASAMLQEPASGGLEGLIAAEEDDGWTASPEPDIPTALKGVDEDGLDGWRSGRGEESKAAAGPEEAKEQVGDGWGEDAGWGEEVEEITLKLVEDEEEAEEGGGQEEKAAGDLATVEREADIEDGWGDDSWGGFGEAGDSPEAPIQLAANLRLSEEREEDGLVGKGSSSTAASPHRSNSRVQDGEYSPRSLALQCKVAERESEFESLEIEHKSLLLRFQTLQDQLRKFEDEKETSERRLEAAGQKEERLLQQCRHQEAAEQELRSLVAVLEQELQASKEESSKVRTETDSAKKQQQESDISQLGQLKEIEQHYNQLKAEHDQLEKHLQQLEGKNADLKAACCRLEVEVTRGAEELVQLRAETARAAEELEQAEADKSDLKETMGHLQERRKSLDLKVSDLQASLASASNELMEYKEKVASLESAGQAVDRSQAQQIEQLRLRAETAESALSQRTGELDDLRMRHGLLTAETAALEEQLTLLKQSEAELLSERSWRQEELASLRVQLETADLRAASSDEEQERAAAELASLRGLLADMSAEREQLQEQLSLQRLQQQQQLPPPPPDVTAGSQQPQQRPPDVARSTQHGNPPDLMPGLVTGGAAAASWFDNFDDSPGWGEEGVDDVQHQQHQQDTVVLQQEIDRLNQHLRELEGRYGILERDKVVLEQAQTQLLVDYKACFEQAATHEEAAGRLSAEVEALRADKAALCKKNAELNQDAAKAHMETAAELESLRVTVATLKAANEELLTTSAAGKAEQLHLDEIRAQREKIEQLESELTVLQASQPEEVIERVASSASLPVFFSPPQQQPSALAALFDTPYSAPVDSFFSVAPVTASNLVPASVEQLEADKKQLVLDLQAAREQVTAFQQQLETEKQQLAYQLQSAQEQIAATHQQLNAGKEQMVQELQEQIAVTQQQLEIEKQQLAQQLQSTQQQLESVQQQLTEVSELRQIELAEKKQLEQLLDLKQSHQENTAANTEMLDLQKKLETQKASQAVAQLQQQLDALMCEMTTKDEQLAQLQQHLAALNQKALLAGNTPSVELPTVATAAEQSQSTVAEQLSGFAEDGKPLATAAHLFPASETQNVGELLPSDLTSPESYFTSLQPPLTTTAALFAEKTLPTAAGLFDTIRSSTAESSEADVAEASQLKEFMPPSAGGEEEYQAWYQQTLDSYQTAIAQWQAWGEEKTAEVAALQADLAAAQESLGAANQEIEKIRVSGADINAASGHHDRINELLKLMRIKDLELEELRETIDRLETEKSDLNGELVEALGQMTELEAARDQMEAHRAAIQLLEETKVAYEKLREDEHRLRDTLLAAQSELSSVRAAAQSDHERLSAAVEEGAGLRRELAQLTASKSQLEAALAQEKQIQEEVAGEFEAMQKEAIEAREAVSALTAKVAQIEGKCLESESLIKELEAFKLQVLEKQTAATEEKSAESLVSQPFADSAADGNDTSQKMAELEAELANCKQYLADWNVWSENKIQEYNQLLEGYNSYVEAYNTLTAEYNNLRETVTVADAAEPSIAAPDQPEERDIQGLRAALAAKEAEVAAKEMEMADLVQAEAQQETGGLLEKDIEIQRLASLLEEKVDELAAKEVSLTVMAEKEAAILLEKNIEIERLSLLLAEKEAELIAKEAELVAKTGELARLCIKTQLGRLTIKKVEESSLAAVMPTTNQLAICSQGEVSVDPEQQHTFSESEPVADWSEAEGWGGEVVTAGLLPVEVTQLEVEISELRQQAKVVEQAKSDLEAELNAAKLKNGKLLVKVKTLTKELEILKKSKGSSTGGEGLDDLDRALEEEMNNQVAKAKAELAEMKKEVESLRLEKEATAKKLSTLESANERLVDMKEKQDLEVEFLKGKVRDLNGQAEGLRWQVEEMDEMNRMETSRLQLALSAYEERSGEGEAAMVAENAQLRLDLTSLNQQLEAADQTIHGLRDNLAVMTASLNEAREEVEGWRTKAEDVKEEAESLKLQLESQQSEKTFSGDSGDAYEEARLLNASLNAEIARLRELVQSSAQAPPLGELGGDQAENLREKLKREQQLVIQLEKDLQNRETALQLAREELEDLRQVRSERSRRESSDSRMSMDRDLGQVFLDQDVVAENLRLRNDLDNCVRENRRLSSRINSWQEELTRTAAIKPLDEKGLQAELSQAIKTLQIKDNKCEELTQENIRLLEERDTLQLKLSSVMRQMMGSAASSRAMTPVPGQQQQMGSPIFDPALQIRELHHKLEELRKLNYALDVELQRERTQRVTLQERVMAPRNRQAAQVLEQQEAESPVQHM